MSSKKFTNDGASSSKGSRNLATTTETTNEPINDPNAGDDKLFEPTLDMMVNDYDDESTLELEERMASTEAQDPNAELNSLQRESDMPIEELLALYNCVTPPVHTLSSSSGSGASRRRSKSSRNFGSEKYLMPPPDPPKSKTPDKELREKCDQTKSVEKNSEDRNTADKAETVVVKDEAKSPESANIQTAHDATESKPLLDQSAMMQIMHQNAKNPIIEKENDANNENGAIKEVKEEQIDEKETSKPALAETNPDQNSKVIESNTKSDDSSPGKSNADEEMDIDEDEEEDDDEEEEEEESELKKLYPETYKTNEPRLLRANSQPNSDDEEEEDIDYSPEEDEFKKKIMVGSEYQAQIPEGLCRYDDALPYENEDKLVWDPSQLQECDIEVYLQKANIPVIVGSPTNSPASPSSQNSMGINQKCPLLPCGNHLRDDEQSLYLLLQCGHNTEEALRRRRLNATLPPVVAVAVAATASNQSPGNDTRMSLWSEEECRNFESGLRVYGKDFHAIQQSKVRTRSVSELVQFYYLWKKTERHDIFANKARLEKKKYNLHPGLTDYMDRFLEEQENNGGISINASNHSITHSMSTGAPHGNNNGMEHSSRDRSISPVINCLLYTDCKRQRRSHETSTE